MWSQSWPPWPGCCRKAPRGSSANRHTCWPTSANGSKPTWPGLRQLPQAERQRLGTYLHANHHRMRYGSYRAAGLLIWSGPIEAALRLGIGTKILYRKIQGYGL